MNVWDKKSKDIDVIKTKVNGKYKVYDDGVENIGTFKSDLSLDDMISANFEACVGKIDRGTKEEKAVFYVNHNYFCLTKKEEQDGSEYYELYNMTGSSEYGLNRVWFPMPVNISLDQDIYQLHLDYKDDYSNILDMKNI
jgi:hypothetical protein